MLLFFVVAELAILGASEDPEKETFLSYTQKKFMMTTTTKRLDCRLGAHKKARRTQRVHACGVMKKASGLCFSFAREWTQKYFRQSYVRAHAPFRTVL